MTSSDLDLDAIEARANAATPGPWREADTHLGRHGHTATVLSGTGNDTDLRAWLPSLSQEAWDETRNVWADAAFIAAARTDVPALVAEVRRLRARQLTASEYNTAWHAVEGAAGEEGADPGTVLHAVLDRLGIEWQTAAHPAAVLAAGETGE